MFSTFESSSANDAWIKACRCVMEMSAGSQPSRAGDTMEVLHAGISISDPLQRWVFSRNPPINPAFALAEVIWIVTGRNDSRFLNYFFPRLPQFAGATPIYPGAYGFRLRRHHGLDQLTRAYDVLQANPMTRQVVLQIWDATTDFPEASGAPRSADVPCNITSTLKIREGKLEWLQVMRSNDLMRGLPYNLVQFTTLQEILAGWLGVEVGSYNHIADSLHVYLAEAEWFERSQNLTPALNTDSLALPKKESEAAFAELERACERIIDSETLLQDLERLSATVQLPNAFQNIFLVICAEGARKRKSLELSQELMAMCNNPALVQLWERWSSSRTLAKAPKHDYKGQSTIG